MEIRYITIEREYGSGGTQIGQILSERTGIPCYGREIQEAVSNEQNLTMAEIEHYEESVSNSFLYTVYALTQASMGNTDMLSREGHIFVAEQAVIQRMAKSGKAIFLGHCASEALKHETGVLRVFIRCTDEQEKKNRIRSDYGIAEQDVERTRNRFDKKRANYFYANTAKHWDDMKNYDLILDSAVLGVDGCVNVLHTLICP